MKPVESKWLRHSNSLLLQYIHQRRLIEGFKGDISLCERRAECLNLAAFFEQLEAEKDPEATLAEMDKRFAKAMARIHDLESMGALA